MFEAEPADDITASFGEPKSKLGSGRYKLIDFAFDRATWDLDEAVDWWNDHDVRTFRAGKYGLDRKLPPVDYWLSFRDGLYVFVCWRTEKGRHSADDYIAGRVDEEEE